MGYAEVCRSVKCAGWADDIGRRDEMEDGFCFVDCFGGKQGAAFFAVYDGHGGAEAQKHVTAHLHDQVLSDLNSGMPTVPDALIHSFRCTDRDLRTRGIVQSGCTACCCLLQETRGVREIFTAHLGDARAVLCRGGVAVRLTSMSDHKATDPVEAERVMNAGGQILNERVNGQLAISRAFGDHQLKAPALPQDVVSNEPDVTSTVLTEGDYFVVVACDGLWDVILDQESVNLVLQGLQAFRDLQLTQSPAQTAIAEVLARMLVEEALARGTSDNVTCMVIFL